MPGKKDFPARRVLVVDDDLDSVRTLQVLLEVCGQAVCMAQDGREALGQVRVFAPDIVLLDLGMPDMDGLEVARRIRAMEGIEQPLIVAMTGYGQTEDRVATREAGFDAHLVKPVTLNRLSTILERDELAVPEPGEPFPLLRGRR